MRPGRTAVGGGHCEETHMKQLVQTFLGTLGYRLVRHPFRFVLFCVEGAGICAKAHNRHWRQPWKLDLSGVEIFPRRLLHVG